MACVLWPAASEEGGVGDEAAPLFARCGTMEESSLVLEADEDLKEEVVGERDCHGRCLIYHRSGLASRVYAIAGNVRLDQALTNSIPIP